MSASVTLSSVSFSLPDGRVLFSDFNFSFNAERTGLVGRNGVGKSTLLKLMTGELSPSAGRIRVRGKLGVLRQAGMPGDEETLAQLFGVCADLERLRRIDAGEALSEDLSLADWTLEARMQAALGRMGLENAGPEARMDQLSGGQRMRAALAALLFAEPDFLLLDEPTNNLDREGRAAVAELLAGWTGGALVVSHDRELLEGMDAIVELTSLGAARYGGGWHAYQAQKQIETEAAGRDLAEAERQLLQVRAKARQSAERKARRDGAGKRKAAKGDAPGIVLGRMKGRAEASGGAMQREWARQQAEAQEARSEARARLEVLQPFSVTLASSGLASGREVLKLDAVTAGYDPWQPVLNRVSFEICGPERIAITGANGTGKSTLLKVIAGEIVPFEGHVRLSAPFVRLDQDVSLLDPELTVLENFRNINPMADENACRSALARFQFRADSALQKVAHLSGGEKLRAGLAAVLGGVTPPQLLMLDEPTNHLDIASLETVETGLSAYDGALLVVSHDAAFLERIGIRRYLSLGG